jgi:phospholipid/cholesterol/gamma-HCH transport system permease protein
MTPPQTPDAASLEVAVSGEKALAAFSGAWITGGHPPGRDAALALLAKVPPGRALAFDTSALTAWDSLFLSYCRLLMAEAAARGMAVDPSGLPQGARGLLELAAKVPEREGAARHESRPPLLERMGDAVLSAAETGLDLLDFLGDVTLAFGRFLSGRAVFDRQAFWGLIQRVGVEALPIVSLISLLVGLILAFVGAIQLRQFGAQIYVATIVGIAMVRVMGAIMTGVIMAGRTGAAFAAELGTMQVNEEIDALTTFGVSPVEYLVLPRILALMVMMPLLCVYSGLMGVMGGFIVGVFMLDINPLQYIHTTMNSVPLSNFWIGLTHSVAFGAIIAMAGCHRGMRCGRSAQAVGLATTSAVVTSIINIIVATAIITVACEVIGV